MKLLSYTSRTQLLIFLLLFGVFSGLFYLVLRWNIRQNVDEVLYNRKMNLLAYLGEHPETIIEQDNPLDDFILHPVSKALYEKNAQNLELYTDTLIYEPTDAELDEYRKLTSYVALNGGYYELEVVKPHLEANEVINTIAVTLSGLFFGLAICVYLSNKMLSKRIWLPFHEMLDKLEDYRVDKERLPKFPNSKIKEFQLLNVALTELTLKNKEVFDNQKQFIGDASHEMQTPLSIIQSKLEALIGQTQLSEKQSDILEGIIGSTQRLKKLNKTLLLLAKIDNDQYLTTEEVNLDGIIGRSLEFYEEQKETLNIRTEIDIRNGATVRGNSLLIEILIQNLLKNAFLHNVKDGKVSIKLDGKRLEVTNTGSEKGIDKEKLFQRFYKSSNNPDSWGLGLAIAYKIADKGNWELTYSHKNAQHTFTVHF
ncbi:HAMP domain-containing histidine kinase [Muricauda ruestringensis]|uniref:histidine kinase n=1 Tax=Flagellimonas aurea TaxID=2915619 RepID=A0ABS3G7M3_9FLAO|nr:MULTISPECIES: HAMP domain-containing sensor histidine kinase [Allomuricauda]MBO0354923.1 HAMP domain-containing histidine kinase [Allomuricauda aurea]